MRSIVPAGQLGFGIQLPVQAQSRLFAEPWEAAAGPAELRQVAEAADRLGFGYLAVCDHVAIPRAAADAMGTTWYETFGTLAFLAAVTRRVRLLSHVSVLAYRHPLVTAKAVATLDALSAGRAVLGVGAGHLAAEFAALGLDFTRRGQLLDAALPTVVAALEQEFVTVPTAVGPLEVGVGPRPVTRPRPPVWVGGSSPAAVRRAARYDGWLPQGTSLADLPGLVSLLREERARAGVREPCDIGANTPWIYVGEPPAGVREPCVSGTAGRIAGQLRPFAELGATHLQVRFPSRSLDELLDQMAAFAGEVAPLLTPVR